MSFGRNVQYLRKIHGGMTQERLAEQLGVSRQTVSRWEADEMYPEVTTLMALCQALGCSIDALLCQALDEQPEVFSPVTLCHVPGFRMARYAVISPNPEDDVHRYMDDWAQRSGLLALPGAAPRRIGWDFPFVSQEQRSRFHMHGYVAAWVLPEGFEPLCGGVELARQRAADYAKITIRDPFAAAFDRIPQGYRRIMEYLGANGFREAPQAEVLECFEHEYEREGETCMDVFIHVQSVGRTKLHTDFT